MTTVGDCMSRHVVYLRAGDRIEVARRPMLDLGLTAIPILDEEHCPVGMVALRDLDDVQGGRAHAGGTVHTVLVTSSIADAARTLAAEDAHHLVVVDAGGAAVGMLSSIDVVRALIGAPPKHPKSIERLVDAKRYDDPA